jgi:hypothetical protein
VRHGALPAVRSIDPGSAPSDPFWRINMASITFNDLPKSEVLDRAAMSCLRGAAGAGNWVLGAFPAYIAPIAQGPGAMQVFNFMQNITNNYTYVGQEVNQVTSVDITNSGANSTNNAVLLTSLDNQAPK